jgi:hypothetical protein
MKSRTTWMLVFIALLIGGLVALDHYKGTTTEDAEARRKHFLDFQAKDVTSLKIELTNQVFVLEKSGDQWQIKQPLNVRANSSTISSILDELEFAERSRTITEKELKGANLDEFGLEKPRARATLRAKKGTVGLLVGNETPTKDALYVQVQGKRTVLVVPKSVYDRLNRTLDDLRDRVVVDFQPASATRLEIKSADRVIELAKSAAPTNTETRWALTRPLAARADARKVSELLADLSALRALDFESEDPKELHTYQLDEPEREVTVWTGESGKTLLLGRTLTNNVSKVYAKLKSADSIFTVPASTARKFAVQANDLRDARVLSFMQDDVRGIELNHGTEKISLARTGSIWNIIAPTPITAEDSVVQQMLGHLADLNATQFVADVATDLDKYGLATPRATVTLRNGTTNDLVQLLVGAQDASNTVQFVKRADEPFVYGVSTNIDAWLPGNYLALRSHRLADLNANQINELTVEKKSGKTVVQRGADKKWRLVEPSQGVLDNDALQRVLDGIVQLQAQELVHEGRDGLAGYGLDQPEAMITVAVGEQHYTLALGKLSGPDRRYALWSDPALVFMIRENQANTVSKDIVTSPASELPAAAVSTNASAADVVSPPSAAGPLSTNSPAEIPVTEP